MTADVHNFGIRFSETGVGAISITQHRSVVHLLTRACKSYGGSQMRQASTSRIVS
jgi:hypothetical protein